MSKLSNSSWFSRFGDFSSGGERECRFCVLRGDLTPPTTLAGSRGTFFFLVPSDGTVPGMVPGLGACPLSLDIETSGAAFPRMLLLGSSSVPFSGSGFVIWICARFGCRRACSPSLVRPVTVMGWPSWRQWWRQKLELNVSVFLAHEMLGSCNLSHSRPRIIGTAGLSFVRNPEALSVCWSNLESKIAFRKQLRLVQGIHLPIVMSGGFEAFG